MIELVAFEASYHHNKVLHDVSVRFRRNRITALIGSSGCGKTTLLKSINRTAELHPCFHASGRILLEDEDIYAVKNPAAVRRQIGLVQQKPLALPLSIRENILFGPRYCGIRQKAELDDITEKTLKIIGLWDEVKDKLHAPAGELSGGQLQRLSIGRTLALNPKVLLLDEPCSSLDMRSTRVIEELLLKLCSRLSIIIVTHNLAQAMRISDETVFMSEGRVIECNVTEQLFATPQSEITQEFLAF